MNNKSTLYAIVSLLDYQQFPAPNSLLARLPIEIDEETGEELASPTSLQETVEALSLLVRPIIVHAGNVSNPEEGEEATDVIITIPLCDSKIYREVEEILQTLELRHEILYTHEQIMQFLRDGALILV